MLNFALSDGVEASRGRNPTQTYLFGPDEVPVPGQFRAEPGLVIAETSGNDAAGLAIQMDLDALASVAGEPSLGIGPLGKVTLTTCLLPNREKPYLLALELARKRIMQCVNKLEEWNLFDLAPDDPAIESFEAARQTFTQALVEQRHAPPQAAGPATEPERLALRSLLLAVDAGERLALRQAENLWNGRMTGSIHQRAVEHYQRIQEETPPPGSPILIPGNIGVYLPARPLIGCSAAPGAFSEPLARVVGASCDFLSVPMRWSDMEPTEGKYSFAGTDKWIEWAVRLGKMPVVAGPIIDFRPSCVPEWLYIWENDYETLRELVAEHVKQVVTRYRRTIRRWTVCGGLHVNSNFPLGFEQMMDLTKTCVLLVRKLHPQANVVLEISQPWGEYYAANRRSVPPQLYADMVGQAALPVDAYGIRLQMGQPRPGQATRDLMSISSILDRFAELEKPLIVTALGCPSAPVSAPRGEGGKPGDQRTGADGTLEPGYWRRPWSESVQAEWLAHVAPIILAKPYVHSLCWQDLYDSNSAPEMALGGLISQAGAVKPAVLKLADLRRAIREAKHPVEISTRRAPAMATA